MVICLERGADLHSALLMPLPLTVSCFSTIQIGFTFLVPAHPGSPGQRAIKGVCVCVDRRQWIQITWMKKSFGLPASDGQRSPLNMSKRLPSGRVPLVP